MHTSCPVRGSRVLKAFCPPTPEAFRVFVFALSVSLLYHLVVFVERPLRFGQVAL